MKGESTCYRVFDVFKKVQTEGSNNISHQQRFVLEDLLVSDPNGAIDAIEQAYLQIARAISSAKRPTEKYSNLMRDLCQSLQKLREAPQLKKRQRSIESSTVLKFFSHMIELFSEMGLSTFKTVRVFGARTLFMVLHSTRLTELADDLTPAVLKQTANCVLELLREKQTDYRKCGIKLASTLQMINSSELQAHTEAIVYELLKIVSTDENQELRSLAVKNLVLKQSTLKEFFLRLRDKSPEIRVTVYKKLIAEKIAIHELGLANLYKVFYDGISSREEIVKQECINCFSYYLQPQKEENRYFEYVNMFNPNVLLHYPLLYTAFCELTSKVLEGLPEPQIKLFQVYLRQLCINMKTKPPTIEIFYVRVASTIPIYSAIIEEHYITGVEQAVYLDKCFRSDKYFEFMECLKLASKFINCDERGRNDLFKSLTEVLRTPTQHTIVIPAEALEYENDICRRLSEKDIEKMRVMNPYYYEPVIHYTEDLVGPIVRLLKEIRPDGFCNELQELLSDIRPDNPEHNLLREYELVTSSIEKLKEEKREQQNVIKSFEGKRQDLSKRISILKIRIIHIMRGLLESSSTVSEPIFKDVVRLCEDNQPLEILLNGLFGLTDESKAKPCFQMVWRNIKDTKPTSDEQENLVRMVSLRVLTDLIVKFKIVKKFPEQPQLSQAFSTFLSRQLFYGDHELRTVAIETMCKLLYHECIDNFNLNFVYIVMLWWNTNTQQGNARSVHVISTLIKQYMEKSAENFQDMSYLLQVYFRTLNIIQESKQVLNPNILKYTMKFSAFARKALEIAMTILRYTKVDGSMRAIPHLRRDRPKESIEIGPQELFILFLLKEKKFEQFVQNALDKSDCLKETCVEVLKLMQEMIAEINRGHRHAKCKTFLADIERRLSVKGEPTSESVQAYRTEFERHHGLLVRQAKQVYRNISQLNILIKDTEASSSSDQQDSSRIPQKAAESSQQEKEEIRHMPRRRNKQTK